MIKTHTIICLFIHLSICPFIHLSICPFIHPSIYLFSSDLFIQSFISQSLLSIYKIPNPLINAGYWHMNKLMFEEATFSTGYTHKANYTSKGYWCKEHRDGEQLALGPDYGLDDSLCKGVGLYGAFLQQTPPPPHTPYPLPVPCLWKKQKQKTLILRDLPWVTKAWLKNQWLKGWKHVVTKKGKW